MSDERIADRAEVFKGDDGKWYVRTLSTNGKIILSSEGYEQPDYAERVAADTGLPFTIASSESES